LVFHQNGIPPTEFHPAEFHPRGIPPNEIPPIGFHPRDSTHEIPPTRNSTQWDSTQRDCTHTEFHPHGIPPTQYSTHRIPPIRDSTHTRFHPHGIPPTASAYPVKEVSGSRPGRIILKTLKKVPNAALFGAEHVRVRVEAVITFSR
jgi:hypothetical protein